MNTIENKVVGDKWLVRRNVVGIPNGLTITDAWMTVKSNLEDSDANAIFQNHITSVSGVAGQIENNGAGGTAVLRFDLTGSQTLLLAPFVSYYYDVQVKDSDGELDTPDTGVIIPTGQVTKATT